MQFYAPGLSLTFTSGECFTKTHSLVLKMTIRRNFTLTNMHKPLSNQIYLHPTGFKPSQTADESGRFVSENFRGKYFVLRSEV